MPLKLNGYSILKILFIRPLFFGEERIAEGL